MLIEKNTLSQKVYDVIRSKISSNEFTPGTWLRERKLASEMGISQTPVREALKRLEEELWIETVPYCGSQVKQLNVEEIIEVYELREVLEGMAARLAAPLINSEQLLLLKGAVDRTATYLMMGDYKNSGDADIEFHRHLVECSKRKRLIELVMTLNLQSRSTRWAKNAGGYLSQHDEYLAEHSAILEALAERDDNLSEILVREHIRKGKEHALAFLKQKSMFPET